MGTAKPKGPQLLLGDAGHLDDVMKAIYELAGADTLAFAAVGFAGRLLGVTVAYRRVDAALVERAEELRPHLAWLLANGSPAGRAYAATLLGRFDPAAARAAWELLARDPVPVKLFHGCIITRTTLAEYAAGRLTTPDAEIPLAARHHR